MGTKSKKSPQIYGYEVSFKDKLDLLRKVLNIHATLTNLNKEKNHLRPKLVDVLSFYILMGYSKETKEMILESMGITVKNLNQINSELTKKGYLVRDTMNFRIKHLSNELKMLKGYFLTGESKKAYLIPFVSK